MRQAKYERKVTTGRPEEDFFFNLAGIPLYFDVEGLYFTWWTSTCSGFLCKKNYRRTWIEVELPREKRGYFVKCKKKLKSG